MHAMESMWPGLVCIMLGCRHVYQACIHLLLPGGKIIASSVPLAKAREYKNRMWHLLLMKGENPAEEETLFTYRRLL